MDVYMKYIYNYIYIINKFLIKLAIASLSISKINETQKFAKKQINYTAKDSYFGAIINQLTSGCVMMILLAIIKK